MGLLRWLLPLLTLVSCPAYFSPPRAKNRLGTRLYSLLPLGSLFREDVCSLLAASLGTQVLLSYVPQPLLFQQLVLLSERTVKVTIANTTVIMMTP